MNSLHGEVVYKEAVDVTSADSVCAYLLVLNEPVTVFTGGEDVSGGAKEPQFPV